MSTVATISMGLTMQMDEASRLNLYQALGNGLRIASYSADYQTLNSYCWNLFVPNMLEHVPKDNVLM